MLWGWGDLGAVRKMHALYTHTKQSYVWRCTADDYGDDDADATRSWAQNGGADGRKCTHDADGVGDGGGDDVVAV